MQQMIRKSELSARLGVTPRTVSRWVADGYLPPPCKIGGIPLWAAATLERAFRERTARPGRRRRG